MTQPADLDGLRIRPSARAVIVEPEGRVLLVRFEFPRGTLWATPGGGQEPGEDDATTVRRELDEEVGLRDPDVGAHLWTRTVIVPFLDGSWDGQCERVYLVRTASFVPRPTMSWDQLMAEHVHELRWWSVEELLEAGQQGVRFAPRELPALVASIVTDGPPASPLRIGP